MEDADVFRDAEWARLRLLALLARLIEQVRDGKTLLLPPWEDTRPGVRWGDE